MGEDKTNDNMYVYTFMDYAAKMENGNVDKQHVSDLHKSIKIKISVSNCEQNESQLMRRFLYKYRGQVSANSIRVQKIKVRLTMDVYLMEKKKTKIFFMNIL